MLNEPAAGQLGYDGIGGSRTSVRSIIASVLPNAGGCPAYTAMDALPEGSPEAAMPQISAEASATVGRMLQGKPARSWPMTPARLRAYVGGINGCDIAAAVRPS